VENPSAPRDLDEDAGMARSPSRFGTVVLAFSVFACLAALLLTGRHGDAQTSNPRWSSSSWLSLSKPLESSTDIRWLSLSKPLESSTDIRWLSLSKPPDPGRVLEHWDQRRAAAYATGNVGALRRLYVPGSRAGASDAQLLQSYAARGLVVTGMRMRLQSVNVIHSGRRRLVLRVRDRLTRAIARSRTDPKVHRQLPTDHPSTHTVTLIRSGSDWLVRSVR
jgi:hypothetical protein